MQFQSQAVLGCLLVHAQLVLEVVHLLLLGIVNFLLAVEDFDQLPVLPRVWGFWCLEFVSDEVCGFGFGGFAA